MGTCDFNGCGFNMAESNEDRYYHMVVLSNKKLLLDDSTTDLVIKVGNEAVHAHAAIISCRCQEIIGFPQDDKKKQKKKLEVKLKDVSSASILSKVLEYLYTGQVDFPKLSDKEILLLGIAARSLKLNRLIFLCEKWLKEHMTIESVFHLLKAATDLNEARAKGFCLAFALKHYNEFISNKDGIYILGIELFQEVVAAFQTNPEPPKDLSEADNLDTLLNDFKQMHDLMPYSDCSFLIGNETIKCHKAVLTAHSDAFANLIRDDSQLKLSAPAFKSMLKFLYYGNDSVDALPACELMSFSRTYKLPSLQRICEEKIRVSIDLTTVLSILAVSYLPADGKEDLVNELRGKCFPFIFGHLSEIDFSRIKTYNPMMVVDLLLNLQTATKKGEFGLDKILAGGGGPPEPSSGGKQSSGGLLGAQRNRPPPPPRGASARTNVPAPPPREKSLPPPSLSTPSQQSDESESDVSESGKGKKKSKKEKREEQKRIKKEKKSVKGKK